MNEGAKIAQPNQGLEPYMKAYPIRVENAIISSPGRPPNGERDMIQEALSFRLITEWKSHTSRHMTFEQTPCSNKAPSRFTSQYAGCYKNEKNEKDWKKK